MHSSPSRDEAVSLAGEEIALQPRRRQVVFGGTGRDGSSESDSVGATVAGGCAVGADWGAREDAVASLVVATGFRAGGAGSVSFS